jgi:hypothetical protein
MASVLIGAGLASASILVYEQFGKSCLEHNWAVTRHIRNGESLQNCDVVERIRTNALKKDAAGAMVTYGILSAAGTAYVMQHHQVRMLPVIGGMSLVYLGVWASMRLNSIIYSSPRRI